MSTELLDISSFGERELKDYIEEAAIARLIDRPALLKASGQQQRIIEVYYSTLAETEDEVLALRAAREAAYLYNL